MTWVLLILIHFNPPSLLTQRFPNEDSCQIAAAWVRLQASPLRIDTICLEDVKK